MHLQLRQVDDRQQGRVEAHLLAGLHMTLRCRSGNGRAHDGIGHRQLGQLQLRLSGRNRCNLHLMRAIGGVERVLRNEVLLDQLRVCLPRAIGHRQLRTR